MTVTISTIYRYPVKSMGGDTLQQTNLTTNGIPGDRCWTLKDEERGGIKGGKRFPHLMSMHATLEQEPDEQTPPLRSLFDSPMDNRVAPKITA